MTTPAERSRAYRDRKRGTQPRQPKPHGTMAAYRRHEGRPFLVRSEKCHDLLLTGVTGRG